MRKNTKILAFLLIISMFLMSFFLIFQYEKPLLGKDTDPGLTIKAGIIDINGNDQLNATASAGNGTAANPYILENYVINASGTGMDGILIQNTDAHFILRNCTIIDADNMYGGIHLSNVKNGIITNNTLGNNDGGIILQSSSNDNVIINNTINGNHDVGIFLIFSSNNNTLTNNIVNDNVDYGIFLYASCENNKLINNTVNNNTDGIHLYTSNDNTLTNNTANDNSQRGIWLYGFSGTCDNNTLTNNTANNNAQGFFLDWYCDDNKLIGNTANDNDDEGIEVYSSSINNKLINNTANNNTNGIFLREQCNFTTLINNTANNNTQYGIYLDYSSNNTFMNNTANNNTQYGIYLDDLSNNNTLTNNIVNNNMHGIRLLSSDLNNISANTANDNDLYGIYLQFADNNNVTWNVLLGNLQCIYQDSCTGNIIENNDCLSRLVLISPQNQTHDRPDISIVVSNSSLIDTMWCRNNSGIGWSSNSTLFFNGTHFENQSALIWADGRYHVQVFANNSLGTEYMIEKYFTIDTQAPTISVTTPMNGTVVTTSLISINGTCNSTGSFIAIIGKNDSRFQIDVNPTGLSEGPFSFINTTNLDGRYDVKINVTDGVGKITERIVWFYVDNDDPTISITNPAADGAIISDIDVFINGTANGTGSPIQSIETNISEFSLNTDPIGELSGDFGFVNSTPLSDGQYIIEINATDDANRSTIDTRMFYVDRTVPSLNITSPATNGSSVSGATIWVNGTVDATGSLIINFVINDTVNFGTQNAPIGLEAGNFSIWNITTLPDGTYSLMINATDSAGYKNCTIIYFIVDNVPASNPTIQLLIPASDNEAIAGTNLILEGNTFGISSNLDQIWTNDSSWSISYFPTGTPGGVFNFTNTTAIADDLYTINITVNNTDGLSASVIRTFYVDNTPPTNVTGLNHSINGRNVALVWDPVTDLTNVTYIITRNGINIINTTSTNYTDPNLPLGTFNYTIYAIDNAGNVGFACAPITVTIEDGGGGGIDPRFLLALLIILLSVIAGVVGTAIYLIVRSRRKRVVAKQQKPISKISKSKIQTAPVIDPELQALREKIEKVEYRIWILNDQFSKGEITESVFNTMLTKYRAQKAALLGTMNDKMQFIVLLAKLFAFFTVFPERTDFIPKSHEAFEPEPSTKKTEFHYICRNCILYFKFDKEGEYQCSNCNEPLEPYKP